MSGTKTKVPSSWELVKLGDFVASQKGKKPKNEAKEESSSHPIPYVDIQAFEEKIVRTWTDGVGCHPCYESDFLMVWDGSRSGLVGKGVNGALGSTLVRINFPLMVNDYAYYFLKSKYQQINTRAKGSGTPHVDPNLLWNYDFPIPPLAEQHRIVAKIEELFSELESGNESLKTAREQLTLYRQAVLKSAFEGELTKGWRRNHQSAIGGLGELKNKILCERRDNYLKALSKWEASGKEGIKPKPPKLILGDSSGEKAILPKLPEGWYWEQITNLAHVGTGVTPLKGRADFYEGGQIPWVTSGALNSNVVTEASDYVTTTALKETSLKIYPKNTLLVAMYGEGKTRGKCSELMIEATINQAIAAIVFEGTADRLRKYIKLFFQKNYNEIRLKSSGGVQPNLNLGIIENTYIPLCQIEEVDAIMGEVEAILSRIDEFESVVDLSLLQIDLLRQSILQKAFSGQLVPQDPNDEPASELLARIKAEVSKSKPSKKKKDA
ncbi:MAG: restriction endonuclease subunit S [Polynucleobacter sp.]